MFYKDTLLILHMMTIGVITSIKHVDNCPKTEESWHTRALIQSCTAGKFYHCLPLLNKTLVEGCLSVYAMEASDGCPLLELVGGSLIWRFEPCNESSGCPSDDWSSQNLYLYPRCLMSDSSSTEDEKSIPLHTDARRFTTTMKPTIRQSEDTSVSNREKEAVVIRGWPKNRVLLAGGIILLVVVVIVVAACIFVRWSYASNLTKINYMPPLNQTARQRRECDTERGLDLYAEIEDGNSVNSGYIEPVTNPQSSPMELFGEVGLEHQIPNNEQSDPDKILHEAKIELDLPAEGMNENGDDEEEIIRPRNEEYLKLKGLEIL